MKAIISRGKTASSYITKNIEAVGFRAIHALSAELNKRFIKSIGLDTLNKFAADISNKRNITAYIDFVTGELGNLEDVVFVHNGILNQTQYLTPLLDSTNVPVLFSFRNPIMQSLSMVRSKQKKESTSVLRMERGLAEKFIRETSHVAGYNPVRADLEFLQYFSEIVSLMIVAKNRKNRFIRYEDMVEQTGLVEAEISWLLGVEFSFTMKSIVNKLTESDYISILAPQFTPTFIEWFDLSFRTEISDVLAYYRYDCQLGDILRGV
ncbi:MAG: hypothetical protein HOH20_03965 [Rhodospirillaceae bacterium]|jgi:hypothetical protein|nr:hypothetical protein [Rhodospirillaceae bacterium]MBT5565865.1 hypothetical protein [Rhodospirillaceae bacterium]MBT6088713.1 hypothetical protein [Rhodospirillaceae bacterium]